MTRKQQKPRIKQNSTTGQRGSAAFRLSLVSIWLAATFWTPAEVLYWPMNGLEYAHQSSLRIQCANHLCQIMQAAHLWSNDNLDQAPPGLQDLIIELGSPELLFCPANYRTNLPSNWTQLDWSQIDYQWLRPTNWYDPTNLACACRTHQNIALIDGSVQVGGYRSGWPEIVAGPLEAYATPKETVHFEVKVARDGLTPLGYQWRREQLRFATNIVRVNNLDDPTGIYWQTNVSSSFTAIPLVGQTNASLDLTSVLTNEAGYYSVAVSNAMGVGVSNPRQLRVDSAFAGITADEHWSQIYCFNNLKMLSLLARMWATAHNDQLPIDWSEMTNADGSLLFGWPLALFCRSDTNRSAPPDWSSVDLTDTSYEIIAGDPQDATAIFCRCKVHGYYAQMDGEAIRQPRFNGITRISNDTVQLNLRVFANRTNILDASPDLIHWTPITTFARTNGDFRILRTNSLARTFYRLRMVP